METEEASLSLVFPELLGPSRQGLASKGIRYLFIIVLMSTPMPHGKASSVQGAATSREQQSVCFSIFLVPEIIVREVMFVFPSYPCTFQFCIPL